MYSTLALSFSAADLQKEDFLALTYYIVRGNQLMVKGSDASTVMSVLNVFKVRANQAEREGEKKESVWVLLSVCFILELVLPVPLNT